MNEISHKCIKCKAEYLDSEEEDYYCVKCNEARLILAKEIDAKMANRISKKPVKSDLQMFNELSKMRGSNFINIKDLGISL